MPVRPYALVLLLALAASSQSASATHVTEKDVVLRTTQGEIGATYGKEYLFGSSRQITQKTITFRYRLVNGTSAPAQLEYRSALLQKLDVPPKHEIPVSFTYPIDIKALISYKDLDIKFNFGLLPGSGGYDALIGTSRDQIKLKDAPAYIPRYRAFQVTLAEFAKIPGPVLRELKTVISDLLEVISLLEVSTKGKRRTAKITNVAVNKGTRPLALQWLSVASEKRPMGAVAKMIEPSGKVVLLEQEVKGDDLFVVTDLVALNHETWDNLPLGRARFLKTDAKYDGRTEELAKGVFGRNTTVLVPAFVAPD